MILSILISDIVVETLGIVQAHSQAVDSARSVSKVTVEFFKTLDTHATKLTGIVEEAQTVNHRKLSEFENKFEVIPVLDTFVAASFLCKL